MKLSRANTSFKSNSFRGFIGHNQSEKATPAWRSTRNMSESVIGNKEKNPSRCYGFIGPEGHFDFMKLKKKIISLRYNTKFGTYWDMMQVMLSLLACGIYVSESYYDSYRAIHTYSVIESTITQFFLVDFIISWYISVNTVSFFRSPMTWVDLVTIIPVYLSYSDSTPNLSLLRFVRILRLIRILRTFRLLGGFSGVKRQIITLSLTLVSMIFLAAGIINLTENTFNELNFNCKYINIHTDFEPSCHRSYSSYDSPSCDCIKHNCHSVHALTDPEHQPSEITCTTMTFFESLYFIVVTTSVVGYGDYAPTTQPSRIATLVFIISALIVIPMQINRLQLLLTMNSPFRTSFEPRPHENHVILCGFVNDKTKLSRFFREFFHPDRYSANSPVFHLLVLNPTEPTDEVKELLNSPLFDSRVSYIIGSALNMEDLQKARADVASGMFFLCNSEVDEEDAVLDDAATVLRTLSVHNFNPDLECLVQVLRAQDRELLKDTDVEVVLCIDEYKTSLQCRNAICPGLATFVDNLFNSFGPGSPRDSEKVQDNWLSEYIHGARMELYYVPIDMGFMAMLGHSWPLLVECVYLEFGCTFMGVCNALDFAAVFNPRQAERKKFKTLSSYFEKHSVGILMAPNNAVASAVGFAMSDPVLADNMIANIMTYEEQFSVRRHRVMHGLGGVGLAREPSTLSLDAAKLNGFGRNMAMLLDLRKTQDLIDGDFVEYESRRRASLKGGPKGGESGTTHIDGGMESDSSQENDDDFVGFVDQSHAASTDVRRRAGVSNFVEAITPEAMIGGDSKSASNEVAPIALKVDTSSKLVRSSSMGFRQVVRKESSLAAQEVTEEGSSSDEESFHKNPLPKKPAEDVQPPLIPDNEMELLDDNTSSTNFKDMRVYAGAMRAKNASNNKKGAANFKSMLLKKNKLRSLKEVTNILKEADNLGRSDGSSTLDLSKGAKGKFAMIAKRAAANSKIAGSRPVSIMSALQQTRRSSQGAVKMSLLDIARAAKAREELVKATGNDAPSEGAVNAILLFATKKPKPKLQFAAAAAIRAQNTEKVAETAVVSSGVGSGENLESSKPLSTSPFKNPSVTHSPPKSPAPSEVNSSPSNAPLVLNVDFSASSSKELPEEGVSPMKGDEAMSFASPGPSIASMVNRFRLETAERRSFRRVLSTRRSASYEENAEGSDGGKKRTDSFESPTEIAAGGKPLAVARGNSRRIIDRKESGNSSRRVLDRKESGNSSRRVLDRKESGGLTSKLVRSDSTVGELITCTPENPLKTQQTFVSPGRRGSVDSGMRVFGDTLHAFDTLPTQKFGLDCEEIEDAASLRNHVIVFGSMDLIHMFIAELRKPLTINESYHQILIVNPGMPRKWYQIQNRFKDVFFLDCSVSSSYELTLMNVRQAYSLVLLAARETISVEDSSNIDSETLFMYLKMERFVPKEVFFTVELVCPNNMGVLNSAIVRRSRIEKDTNQKGNWGGTSTGLASSVKGVHNFRTSMDVTAMLNQLRSEAEYNKQAMIVKQTSGTFSRMASSRKIQPIGVDAFANDRRMSMSAMRRSSSGAPPLMASPTKKESQKMSSGNYWDVLDTHHMLPVFASGRAVTSTSYDSMLCQSFFGVLTPQLCEKLIGGQDTQTMMHVRIPSPFFGRKYVDLFRALNSRMILPLAMYRIPLPKNDAILSYVYTNPNKDSIVNKDDHLLIFGNPATVAAVLKKLELPLVRKNGKMSLGEEEKPRVNRMTPVNEGEREQDSVKGSTGRFRPGRMGLANAAAAYQPIQAKKNPLGESTEKNDSGKSVGGSAGGGKKGAWDDESMDESIELISLKKPEEEQGITTKGWGGRLEVRVHPVSKYVTRRLSGSNSPPVGPQRSKDTADLDAVMKFTSFDAADTKEKTL